MEGHKQFPYGKRSKPQFKRKGGSKRGRRRNSSREQNVLNSNPVDTIYRILCPSSNIGGVIGKGGTIVRSLREETQAKITVAESVPGSDERVILIYSPPTKVPKGEESNDELASEDEDTEMEPLCPAQDALLKVHERIVVDDFFGGMTFDDDIENSEVTARLLVPQTMVGCLIGKGGDVIQKLRSETKASIRVLPKEDLPSCAMITDELVQISGTPSIVKKALYVVSTKLHQNPRKENNPLSLAVPFAGEDFLPPRGPIWPHPNSYSHGVPPISLRGRYRNEPFGFVPGGFDGVSPRHGDEASGEFSLKILCSSGKIGRVIGKAASIVKQLEQETGANIRVGAVSTDLEERVICVSAFEDLWNPRSQTIDAVLELQNKIREYSEEGQIITRLLVPSSKIGCLIGEGGHIINEMRRRTQADIRILPKNDNPKCAPKDEELVQISASFSIARDALGEIGSRLRTRTLRDANAGDRPYPDVPFHEFGPGPRRGPMSPGVIGAGNSVRYELAKIGRHEYEHQSYPVLPIVSRLPQFGNYMEPKFPNDGVGSTIGIGRSNNPGLDEVTGARVLHQDSQPGGPEGVADLRGSSEHLTAAQRALQAYTISAGQNINLQQNTYPSYAPQVSFQSLSSQHQEPYQGTMVAPQGSQQGISAQQVPYQGSSYQGATPQQEYHLGSHQGNTAQQGSYQDPLVSYQSAFAQQGTSQEPSGSHQNAIAQQGFYQSTYAYQDFYQNANAQQNIYQGTIAQLNAYQNTDAQQGSYQSSSAPQGSSY